MSFCYQSEAYTLSLHLCLYVRAYNFCFMREMDEREGEKKETAEMRMDFHKKCHINFHNAFLNFFFTMARRCRNLNS